MEFVNSIAQIVHQEVGGLKLGGRAGGRARGGIAGKGHVCLLAALLHASRCNVPPNHTAPCLLPSQVALHGGAANKNIGDAFLLVWKLPSSRRDVSRRSSLATGSLARSRSQGSCLSRASSHTGVWAGGKGVGEGRGEEGVRQCWRLAAPMTACLRSTLYSTLRPACSPALQPERLSAMYGAGAVEGSGPSASGGSVTTQRGALSPEEATAAIADAALASFIIIQAALKRSARLREYCQR